MSNACRAKAGVGIPPLAFFGILFLVSCSIFLTGCDEYEKSVTVHFINASPMTTDEFLEDMWPYMERRFKAVGIVLTLRSYERIKPEQFGTIVYDGYADHYITRGCKQHSDGITLCVLPPTSQGWITGQASGICAPNGYAHTRATRKKLRTSRLVAVHEIAHLLGATHKREMNIMHPHIMRLTRKRKGGKFLLKSVVEMHECMGTAEGG